MKISQLLKASVCVLYLIALISLTVYSVTAAMLTIEEPQFFKTAVIRGFGLTPNINFCLSFDNQAAGCGSTNAAGNFAFNFFWPDFAENATNITLDGFFGMKTFNLPDNETIFVPLTPAGNLTIEPRQAGSSVVIFGTGFPVSCSFLLKANSQNLGAGFSFADNWGFNFGNGAAVDSASEFVWQGLGSCTETFIGFTMPSGPYPKTVEMQQVKIVEIDIKPGSEPNSIKCNKNKVIPVAILSTNEFDATTIDHSTVTFGPSKAKEIHNKSHFEDIDDDGDIDMILHFKFFDTGIQCGDKTATLTGKTFDNETIIGTDGIRTI